MVVISTFAATMHLSKRLEQEGVASLNDLINSSN